MLHQYKTFLKKLPLLPQCLEKPLFIGELSSGNSENIATLLPLIAVLMRGNEKSVMLTLREASSIPERV